MKTNKVLIVCSETNLDLQQYQDYYKIGVERGALDLIKNFATFDLFCCDQDSLTTTEAKLIANKAKELLIVSQIKDHIDGELALQEALKLNPQEIIFIAQGNRFDMELSCFNFICCYNIIFMNDNTYAYLLKPGMNEVYQKSGYRYFSLFSLQSATVTISNLKYNAKQLKLVELSPNAVSNEFLASVGNIDVLAGQVIAIYSK
ncbi:thiamine diphosphokinase [Spiroplasma citri]|uniref:Thiamine diphosphokinase n=1 Tax=Spiroplasma citri TaxID=2133 RepID=Q14LR8_SPICI|nr:thiamine diphosphokinase [Spiroplasma citri]APE75439.1 putative thiamin pyrophosphokinase [Spiroplasma citri]QED25300.1 thiamine diphosphokinase [Spiroplasma citri]QIA67647.1 thiamine diphosphokinase [Spiroplasma citri]QIA69497.1 thiamine diphosphokinase [Spiroplasma citri]QIA71360.1 thiamine diphosphokinase [Spiroplasma citri]